MRPNSNLVQSQEILHLCVLQCTQIVLFFWNIFSSLKSPRDTEYCRSRCVSYTYTL